MLNIVRQYRRDFLREHQDPPKRLLIHPEFFARLAEESAHGEFYIDLQGRTIFCGMVVEGRTGVDVFEIS